MHQSDAGDLVFADCMEQPILTVFIQSEEEEQIQHQPVLLLFISNVKVTVVFQPANDIECRIYVTGIK